MGGYVCPQCDIGRMRYQKRAHVCVHAGLVISVPDMPVFVCDACGYQEFEPLAYVRLEHLLASVTDPTDAPVKPSSDSAGSAAARSLDS